MDLSFQQQPKTPQKPPGAFFNTPGPLKTVGQRGPTAISAQPSQPNAVQQQRQTQEPPTQKSANAADVTAIERAARTINNALDEEGKYPALDNYVNREWIIHNQRELGKAKHVARGLLLRL